MVGSQATTLAMVFFIIASIYVIYMAFQRGSIMFGVVGVIGMWILSGIVSIALTPHLRR